MSAFFVRVGLLFFRVFMDDHVYEDIDPFEFCFEFYMGLCLKKFIESQKCTYGENVKGVQQGAGFVCSRGVL